MQLAPGREPLLALAGDAGGEQLLLQVRLQLLDHEQAVHGVGEVGDGVQRQRVDHAELEEGRLGQRFSGAHVRGAGRDDADARRAAVAQAHLAGGRLCARQLTGQGARLGVGAEALDPLEQAAVQGPREARQQAVLLGDAVRRLALRRRAAQRAQIAASRAGPGTVAVAVDVHDGLLVRRLDAEAHHHRHVELLAHREGALDILVALLTVGRLEHGHGAHAAEVAVVLLGHAAGHAGVAGQADHEPGVDAGVDGADERVGGHTGAGALHGREGTSAAHGRPEGHLVGDLLVGGPLGVHALVAREVGDDLGAGRAGVRGRDQHTGLPGPAGDGLVAEHQVRFHTAPCASGALGARRAHDTQAARPRASAPAAAAPPVSRRP